MKISSPVAFLDLYKLRCATLSPGASSPSSRRKTQEQYFLHIDLREFMEPVIATLDLQNSSQELVAMTTLATLSTNSPPVNTGRVIKQEATQNAVILDVNKRWRSEKYLLAHLPRLHSGEDTFVSLLQFDENDKWVKLVWNKAPQDSYSTTDTPSPYLPSIILTKREKMKSEYKRTELNHLRDFQRQLISTPRWFDVAQKEYRKNNALWSENGEPALLGQNHCISSDTKTFVELRKFDRANFFNESGWSTIYGIPSTTNL